MAGVWCVVCGGLDGWVVSIRELFVKNGVSDRLYREAFEVPPTTHHLPWLLLPPSAPTTLPPASYYHASFRPTYLPAALSLPPSLLPSLPYSLPPSLPPLSVCLLSCVSLADAAGGSVRPGGAVLGCRGPGHALLLHPRRKYHLPPTTYHGSCCLLGMLDYFILAVSTTHHPQPTTFYLPTGPPYSWAMLDYSTVLAYHPPPSTYLADDHP